MVADGAPAARPAARSWRHRHYIVSSRVCTTRTAGQTIAGRRGSRGNGSHAWCARTARSPGKRLQVRVLQGAVCTVQEVVRALLLCCAVKTQLRHYYYSCREVNMELLAAPPLASYSVGLGAPLRFTVSLRSPKCNISGCWMLAIDATNKCV